MSHDIIRASDLSRSDLDTLLTPSFEQANNLSLLGGNKIVIARYDDNMASLDEIEEIIDDQGGAPQFAPAPTKGQPLEALAQQIDSFNADAVIFNHPQDKSAQVVADLVRAPLLNAGDGANENPVRALIDLHAISQAKGSLSGLRVALLGNLKVGAVAHSLAYFLSLYELRLSLVSPAALSMPYDLTDDLRANGIEVEETNDLPTTLRKSDVLYLTRIDPTRVEAKIFEKTNNFYNLTPAILDGAKPGLFVLGEWTGAEELLEAGSGTWEKSFYTMIPALLDFAIG